MSRIRLAQYAGHIFLVRTAMTPAQVKIVQDSFRALAPKAAAASSFFYAELFRLSPGIRQLFPQDMAKHELKFLQMLATVVKALDKIETVSQELADLGRRHLSYDVEDEHYAAVGAALMSMLEELLGADCTPEIKDAWNAAYDMLARVMQDAAILPATAEAYFGGIIRSVIAAQYGLTLAAPVGKPGKTLVSRKPERGQVVRFP
ncbi:MULTISPECIES: globin domain-containing protein [Rhodomicrobium]|uniref:globin domain-containing protein n=1 Tax=Rhodomicrobium TaxID=1068 RepID=UPI000B4B2E5B|nr:MULTISPECIES: globin domain-containing protein [Rhodomicrobium]